VNQLTDEAFHAWLAEGGIGSDPRYPNSYCLVFLAAPDCSRFWFPSFVPSDLPGFINAALDAASSTAPYYLYRRGGGRWFDESSSGPGANQTIEDLLRAVGLPASASGALRLERSEWRVLQAIVIAFYVYGWSVGEDLYILPTGRDCILMTSHHGELAVEFPTEARLEQFRAAMLQEGYDLPTQVPDGTFKGPDWLKGRLRHGAA
jgi:hypothetical protein